MKVKIKLSVKKENGKLVIEHKFDDDRQEEHFNKLDRERFFEKVRPKQLEAKRNKALRAAGENLEEGAVVSADDYKGEPDDIHAGIHLSFKAEDEIVWTTEERINFIVDVGPDPELVRLENALLAAETLKREDLLSEKDQKYNPFRRRFPDFCTKGHDLSSGPLDSTERVVKQQFYKYQVTVLGTEIVLDPHIEGHDD